MDKNEFKNPNGEFLGNTFSPKKMPRDIQLDPEAILLSIKAHTKLGYLEGIVEGTNFADIITLPYIVQEATASSSIEGTSATIQDVFRSSIIDESDTQEYAIKQTHEVLNCVESLNVCGEAVKNKQLDLEMILQAHKILTNSVEFQTPGKFRMIQNWISSGGRGIDKATYVPPAPEKLKSHLDDFEKFLLDPPMLPIIVQCAIIHQQFETIHPFTDGNGRVGRMLIPLLLIKRDIISKPLLYLSGYFEKNRRAYYYHLLNVNKNSAWLEWIKFFLNGIIIQVDDAIDKIRKLTILKTNYENRMNKEKSSPNTMRLLPYIFYNPFITIPHAVKYLNITYPTAKLAICNLQKLDILTEVGIHKRNKIFKAPEILNIFS